MSTVERIFRSLNKQRVPSLGVVISPFHPHFPCSHFCLRVSTRCRDNSIHESFVLATEDRQLAFAVSTRILFPEYFRKRSELFMKSISAVNFWKPYVVPFIHECIDQKILTQEYRCFSWKIPESVQSHKAHVCRLGSMIPTRRCVYSVSRFFKVPIIHGIRKLMCNALFVSECSALSVQLVGTEKRFAVEPTLSFEYSSMTYSLGSFALYMEVLEKSNDHALAESILENLTTFAVTYRSFTCEEKLSFLTKTIYGGAFELEFDTGFNIDRENLPWHEVSIYAHISEEYQLQTAKYTRFHIMSYKDKGSKKSVKAEVCRRAINKYFKFITSERLAQFGQAIEKLRIPQRTKHNQNKKQQPVDSIMQMCESLLLNREYMRECFTKCISSIGLAPVHMYLCHIFATLHQSDESALSALRQRIKTRAFKEEMRLHHFGTQEFLLHVVYGLSALRQRGNTILVGNGTQWKELVSSECLFDRYFSNFYLANQDEQIFDAETFLSSLEETAFPSWNIEAIKTTHGEYFKVTRANIPLQTFLVGGTKGSLINNFRVAASSNNTFNILEDYTFEGATLTLAPSFAGGQNICDYQMYSVKSRKSPLVSIIQCYLLLPSLDAYLHILHGAVRKIQQLSSEIPLQEGKPDRACLFKFIRQTFALAYGCPLNEILSTHNSKIGYYWTVHLFISKTRTDGPHSYSASNSVQYTAEKFSLALAKSPKKYDALYEAYRSLVVQHFPPEIIKVTKILFVENIQNAPAAKVDSLYSALYFGFGYIFYKALYRLLIFFFLSVNYDPYISIAYTDFSRSDWLRVLQFQSRCTSTPMLLPRAAYRSENCWIL